MYRKNLPLWERWLRIILGVGLIAYAVVAAPPVLLAALAVVSAAAVIATGFIGFCPACAVAGRKPLDQDTPGH